MRTGDGQAVFYSPVACSPGLTAPFSYTDTYSFIWRLYAAEAAFRSFSMSLVISDSNVCFVSEAEVTLVTVRFVYDTTALNALFADLPEQSAIPQIISSALTR